MKSYRENLIKAGRCFYGTGVAAIGIQQFIHADFRPVISPAWPPWIHGAALAYIVGAALAAAGAFIIFGKNIKTISLLLAAFFFILFLAFQFPYIMFIQPNLPRHLGLWTNPLKEVAFSGGAFVMAASVPGRKSNEEKEFYAKERLMTAGRIFFSIMLIAFGIDHFYYTVFVATLVPSWIPGHIFWTYFGAVCLIGSGVAIIFKIFITPVAILLGTMLFLWLVILHIPRAIADPYIAQGNEITSVFEALAFSGIAFVIGGVEKNKTNRIEKGQ